MFTFLCANYKKKLRGKSGWKEHVFVEMSNHQSYLQLQQLVSVKVKDMNASAIFLMGI